MAMMPRVALYRRKPGYQPIGEGALADAGRPGDAYDMSFTGMTMKRVQPIECLRRIIFDEIDEAGSGAVIAL
jgi:hypothetical protein